MSKIVFRVDGGAKTGLGHLVRSLALADMLKEDYSISFVCKEVPDSIVVKIKSSNFEFIKIENEEEFFEIANSITVVLDGYSFKADYQKRLKDQNCKVACIDDLHEGEFYADLIINHAPGITPEDYKAQPYTKYALGLEYALLRPAFIEASRLPHIEKGDEKVLICFGGADPENLTLRALNVVKANSKFTTINVVTGASYSHTESLAEQEDNRIQLYSNLSEEEMCSLMKDCDVAIVPSSSILLEAMACGLKVITCYYVDNQKDFHDGIVKKGICSVGFADGDFEGRLRSKIDNVEVVNEITGTFKNSRTRNLVQFYILSSELKNIELSRITNEDLDITYSWASNSKIRNFSFNSKPIPYEEHKLWFRNKLINDDCFYYIAKVNHVPIGSIRYDVKDGDAIISFLIDPEFHGIGLSSILLKRGYEVLLPEKKSRKVYIRQLSGFVLEENIASRKAFLRAGYNEEKVEGQYLFVKEI